MLPPAARIDTTAARAGTVSEMTAAFSLNLTALSLLALVVGMFLIYNTVTFSVVQRRPVLGTLRALGMTRREIFALILGEAGLLGVTWHPAGTGTGRAAGPRRRQMVTQTVNDLFFVVAVREFDVPLLTLVKGAVIGVAGGADRRGCAGLGGNQCAASGRAQTQQYRRTHPPPAALVSRGGARAAGPGRGPAHP